MAVLGWKREQTHIKGSTEGAKGRSKGARGSRGRARAKEHRGGTWPKWGFSARAEQRMLNQQTVMC